jgi:hypothetical protein
MMPSVLTVQIAGDWYGVRKTNQFLNKFHSLSPLTLPLFLSFILTLTLTLTPAPTLSSVGTTLRSRVEMFLIS